MTPSTLLSGKRIAILGSAGGLGLTLARAAQNAGAEVHGIDRNRNFEAVAAFYRADLADPDALGEVAQALPMGLDGVAFVPALPGDAPRDLLIHGLLAPRVLAQSLAPRLAHGAAIVMRGAPVSQHWEDSLPEIRAAMALRHEGVDSFIPRWGLHLDPARTSQTVGWALYAWAMAQCATLAGRGIRINTLTPASPDGSLPPTRCAVRADYETNGTLLAADAALFLLSDLSRGMTGANLVTDGGLTAQRLCRRDGL
ncbi:MAG: NAD-dependent epimerase/dehydratase family protein [Rhodobacteraceae bacterium]|nr:MAG: NAD-dependent epimerase/dehydratase family protein [Paracoccaceae bacterium]